MNQLGILDELVGDLLLGCDRYDFSDLDISEHVHSERMGID